MSRSATSGEHFAIAAHLLLVSLPLEAVKQAMDNLVGVTRSAMGEGGSRPLGVPPKFAGVPQPVQSARRMPRRLLRPTRTCSRKRRDFESPLVIRNSCPDGVNFSDDAGTS
jgi:hypothetical protein